MRQYIEFKGGKTPLNSTDAKKIIAKDTISIVLAVAKIYKPARVLFDRAGIIWVDELPEAEIRNHTKNL